MSSNTRWILLKKVFNELRVALLGAREHPLDVAACGEARPAAREDRDPRPGCGDFLDGLVERLDEVEVERIDRRLVELDAGDPVDDLDVYELPAHQRHWEKSGLRFSMNADAPSVCSPDSKKLGVKLLAPACGCSKMSRSRSDDSHSSNERLTR